MRVCVCVRSWTYTYLHMRTPCDSFYLIFSIFCFLSGFLCCLILAPFLFARSLFCLPGSPSCTLVDLLACSLACLLFAWRVCLPSYGSYRNMVLFPFYWLPSFLPSFPPSLPPPPLFFLFVGALASRPASLTSIGSVASFYIDVQCEFHWNPSLFLSLTLSLSLTHSLTLSLSLSPSVSVSCSFSFSLQNSQLFLHLLYGASERYHQHTASHC